MIGPELIDALDGIEARFAGPRPAGTRAVGAIRARLEAARAREEDVEIRFSIPDVAVQLTFMHLCRRYGIKPYRAPRQQQTGLSVKAPRSFVFDVLSPIYDGLTALVLEHTQSWVEELMTAWSSDPDALREALARARASREPRQLGLLDEPKR